MTTKPANEAMREASEAFADAADRYWREDSPHSNSVDAGLVAALRALDAAGWSVVSQEILTAIRMQIVALIAGSCSCGMKSPNAALHPADCRYAQLASVLDNLDALAAAPKLPGVGDG